MSSKRLPGKTLQQVAGKPLIEYVLDRLHTCRTLSTVAVCTSTDSSDDPIADYCERQGVTCVRGSLPNVAERLAEAISALHLDAFARVCADSPLLDAALVDLAVSRLRDTDAEIVTNVHPRSFPAGQSVEALRAPAYLRGFLKMTQPDHLEHVTKYFYDNPAEFHIDAIPAPRDYGDLRLVVDTPDDLAQFTALIERMARPYWAYSLNKIVELAGESSPQVGGAA